MEPKIVAAGDGELLEFDDWAAIIKIAAEESDGTVTVLETRHDPGNGADAHTHSRESEIFFVLEGRVTFTVGDALQYLSGKTKVSITLTVTPKTKGVTVKVGKGTIAITGSRDIEPKDWSEKIEKAFRRSKQ